MPLLAFWSSNPQAVDEVHLDQVVAMAGNGVLRDYSPCSEELREYLAQIKSSKLATYIDYCLSSAFQRSGMVLQDLVNELGRRLDYKVTNGRYHGTANTVGFDGVWLSPEGHALVVEVKTTDAYRISLETIANYREKLLNAKSVSNPSSILIVVGREDTGELEAQVRGSRHAWDIRLISADSLIKLVQLKENAEDPETDRKIRSLLTPMEYTRLDQVIDVVFTTAKDVETASVAEEQSDTTERRNAVNRDVQAPIEKAKGGWEFTDSHLLQGKREDLVTQFGRDRGINLVRKSRAVYWDNTHATRLVCTISKRYPRTGYPYWYAYHPQWDEFLADGQDSFFILGCMDLPFGFCLPWKTLHASLDALNTTTTDKGHTYWHIHLTEAAGGKFAMLLPKKSQTLALDDWQLSLGEK